MRDLEDVPELGAGHKRDKVTGEVFYWSRWLDAPTPTVGELPAPELTVRDDGPADPDGAAVIASQLRTVPRDRWIGPRRLMNGLHPRDEDLVRHAAAIFVDTLNGARRAGERLAEVAGVGSPYREQANGAAAALTRLARRVEQDCKV